MIDAQIAIDLCGAAPGEPVEIQAKTAPGHCRTKLAGSGHSFAGVFKANSSLAELCLWFRFRALYERALPESYAVRSAG